MRRLLLPVLLIACGDDPVDEPTPTACEQALIDFSPCGGALAGTTWTASGFCQDPPGLPPFRLDGCEGFTSEGGTSVIGSINFADAGLQSDLRFRTELAVRAPGACLAALDPDPATACEALAAQSPGATCALDGTACACEVITEQPLSLADTWSLDGSTLVIGASRYPFCVEGNTLTFVDQYERGGEVFSSLLTFSG